MADSVIEHHSNTLGESYFDEGEDGLNGNHGRQQAVGRHYSPECDTSGVCSSCTTSGENTLNATHKALSTFIPRHNDELLLDIGDSIHVERTNSDHWSTGE